jgi:predicted GTPase
MNDIAYVEFEIVSPLFFDPYTQNRITGSFILIDPISNATLGAGMIRADLADQTVADEASLTRESTPVTSRDRYKRHGHYPGLILVEDNPGLATILERALFDDHFEVLLVNGDALPVPILERQYAAFESAGLVVIYSCAALASEARRRLGRLAGNHFFDFSTLPSPRGAPFRAENSFTSSIASRGCWRPKSKQRKLVRISFSTLQTEFDR